MENHFPARVEVATRDNDLIGVSYVYIRLIEGRFLEEISVKENAHLVETLYSVAITPAAQLTLDVQVANPVSQQLDPAVFLGDRLNLRF